MDILFGGNEFDKSLYIPGELESHKFLGEQHLVHARIMD